MNAFFVLGDDVRDVTAKFDGAVALNIVPDVASESEIISLLEKGEIAQISKMAIAKFDAVSKNAKCVIVYGVKGFDEVLNFGLSKDLALPVVGLYTSESKAKIAENFAKKCGAQVLRFTTKDVCADCLGEALKGAKCEILTPVRFESTLYAKAAANKKSVVLPEADDERILCASEILLKSGAVNLVLLGDEAEIKAKAGNLGLNLDGVKIINPANNEFSDEFANTLYELRKAKGMELEKAQKLVRDRTFFGTMLVYSGKADAMVSGASTTTAETIRPALQTIKTMPGVSTVSGSFIMCLDSQIVIFADCAVVPNPDANALASIAISSANTARAFGLEPRVAMLSYSTKGSGSGPSVEIVEEATKLVGELAPDLAVDGPLQFDAAFDPTTASKKAPGSAVAGKANVFVFPDLNAGNIGYKAVQRTSGAVAIGPILQGLKKPVNDLSRGCKVEDIVNTVLISAIQAGVN
ncbi:phosphate acetyltransferase [Campylobacter sp. JMF_02 ED1]|uniref:phosphate acetyltransferase n=1 Tax=unclassified Campylobacter TaxID=2593542 RepID=UPI0022E9FA76|nr:MULTISPECIES: phosphate acetyltransferase [unclassified Campylobacter]MDA3049317.1 phosphate acetyltransferase [Campylobacter sp. JMF_15 NE4]MDA3051258.1 phosphate acetyltransferase [Campylobacter sp. JMF_02 ED1]